MTPRLYWTPTNALGTAWALMFEFDWKRRIAELRATPSRWLVPVLGGECTFERADLDRAVDLAERDGCGRYGLAPPLWRSARARLLKEAVRP